MSRRHGRCRRRVYELNDVTILNIRLRSRPHCTQKRNTRQQASVCLSVFLVASHTYLSHSVVGVVACMRAWPAFWGVCGWVCVFHAHPPLYISLRTRRTNAQASSMSETNMRACRVHAHTHHITFAHVLYYMITFTCNACSIHCGVRMASTCVHTICSYYSSLLRRTRNVVVHRSNRSRRNNPQNL